MDFLAATASRCVMPPHSARAPGWLPIALAGGVVVLVGAYLAYAINTEFITLATVATAAYAVTFASTGAVVWLRRPDYRTGQLMVLAGYLTLVSPLQRLPEIGALFAIGSSLNGLQEAVLAYLLLTYPSGRAGHGFVGFFARFAVVIAFVMAIADLVTRQNGTPCFVPVCSDQPNPFLVVDLGSIVADVSRVGLAIAAAAVLAIVVWRFIDARGASRRVLAPLLVAGGVAAVGVVVRQAAGPDPTIANISRFAQLLIPIALGVGFVRSRMARAGVADLVLHAGPAPTAEELEASIRRTLHDPSVRLLRWSSVGDCYLDAGGRVADTREGPGRELTVIPGLAAIEHDPVLAEEGDLLPSVVAAVRIVLENDRLATSVQAQARDAASLPGGTVTFISTDIEGSTALLDQLRGGYADLLSELRQLLRRAVREAGGSEIDSRADEFFAAIPDASEAIRAAISIQRQLEVHPWPEGARVRIRLGLHTGEPGRTAEGYVGMDVHMAARVGAVGHGGQIVASDTTREAIRERIVDASFTDLGRYELKGIPRPVRLYQVAAAGQELTFAPLRAEPTSA
jgi:class 3 adenylate cyclase